MRKLEVTIGELDGLIFEFYDSGNLATFQMPEYDMSTNKIEWLSTHWPFHIDILNYWKQTLTVCKITPIETPILFEDFWKLYNKKVGSRAEAELYWDGFKRCINKRNLTSLDRQDIMRILKKYVARFPGEQKTYQPLATTFLHQRLWEAELEALLDKVTPNVGVAQLLNKWQVR